MLQKYHKIHEERQNISLKLSQVPEEELKEEMNEEQIENLSDGDSEEEGEEEYKEEVEPALSKEDSYIRKKLAELENLPSNFTQCELVT